MNKNYNHRIEMNCPNCKNKKFEYDQDDENSIITCFFCKRQFTKDELLHLNKKEVDKVAKKIGEEMLSNFATELKKSFKNNKYMTIK